MADELKTTTKKKSKARSKSSSTASRKVKAAQESVKDTIKDTIIKKMQTDQEATTDEATPFTPVKMEEEEIIAPPRGRYRSGKRKSATDEVSFFLRQLSILLSAGITLSKSLHILVKRVRNDDLHAALEKVIRDVESGAQFWSALSEHPKFFNSMAVNVIRTGEESGSLIRVVNYLASYRDRESEMMRSVQKSVTYPLFLMILSIAVILVLVTTVIPMFASQFAEAGVALPWPTRFLIGLSATLTNFWLIVFVIGGGGYWIYRQSKNQAGFWKLVDRVKISLPIFGKILTHIYTVQFASMMSILLNAGLSVPKSLELVGETMSNSLFRDAFHYVRANIVKGRSLFESFLPLTLFPPLVQDMVSVGEESGSLPVVLDQLAEIYKKEVDYETAIIGTLIEPVLIVGLGLVVGFIALAMFMPYFKMITIINP